MNREPQQAFPGKYRRLQINTIQISCVKVEEPSDPCLPLLASTMVISFLFEMM